MESFLRQHGIPEDCVQALLHGGCITIADLEHLDEQVLDDIGVFKPMDRRKLLMLKFAQVPPSARFQELVDLMVKEKILIEHATKYAVALTKEGFDSPEKLANVTKEDLDCCDIVSLMDVRIILSLQTTSDSVSRTGRRLSVTRRQLNIVAQQVDVQVEQRQRLEAEQQQHLVAEAEQKQRLLAEAEEQKRLFVEFEKQAAAEAEQQRLAAEAEQQQRLDDETAAQQRLDKEAAQQRRLAEEAAEQRRLAEEAAEQRRLAEEAAEQRRLADEAEKCLAAEAEQQRLAEAAVEQQRLAAEAVDQQCLAETAEQQRLADEAAEQQHIAAKVQQRRLAEETEQQKRLAEEEEAARQAEEEERHRIAAEEEERLRLEKLHLEEEALRLALESQRIAEEEEEAQRLALERQRIVEEEVAAAKPAAVEEPFELGRRENSSMAEDGETVGALLVSKDDKQYIRDVQEETRWEKRTSNLESTAPVPHKHNTKDWRGAALEMRERVNNLKLVAVAGLGNNSDQEGAATATTSTATPGGDSAKTPCDRFRLNLIAPQQVMCLCGFPKVMHNDFMPKKKTLKEFQPHDFNSFGGRNVKG